MTGQQSANDLNDIDELQADLEALGFSDEDQNKVVGRFGKAATDFTVHPDNWLAVQVFLSCTTQWRHSMNRITGLDYGAVLKVIELFSSKRKKRQKLFGSVKLIEIGALRALQKASKRNG